MAFISVTDDLSNLDSPAIFQIYENPVPGNEGTSHYTLDYIMMYLVNLAWREMQEAGVLARQDFQFFLSMLNSYDRILTQARYNRPPNSGTWDDGDPFPTPPYGTTNGFSATPKLYTCNNTHTYGDKSAVLAKRLFQMTNQYISVLDFRTIPAPGGGGLPHILTTFGGTVGSPFPPTYYWEPCTCAGSGLTTFFREVALPTIQAYQNYALNKNKKAITTEDVLNSFHQTFQNNVAQLQDELKNAGYASTMQIIKVQITNIIQYFNDLLINNKYSSSILTQSVDPSRFWEKLKFKYEDVNDALIRPKDAMDFVSPETEIKKLEKATEAYTSETTTVSDLLSLFSPDAPIIPPSIVNPSAVAIAQIKKKGKVTDFPNVSQRVLQIFNQRIYSDIDGKVKAELMSEAREMAFNKQIVTRYNDFLNVFSNDDPTGTKATLDANLGKKVAMGREVTYAIEYQPNNRVLLGGSRSVTGTNPFPRQIQQGGTSSIGDIYQETKKSETMINETKSDFDKIEMASQENNHQYLDNDTFANVEIAKQGNSYLVNLMQTMMSFETLLGQNTSTGKNIKKTASADYQAYESALEGVWSHMKALNQKVIDPTPLINLVTSGIVNFSEVSRVLGPYLKHGYDPTKDKDLGNSVISQVNPTLATIRTLFENYGDSGTANVAHALQNIYPSLAPPKLTGDLKTAQAEFEKATAALGTASSYLSTNSANLTQLATDYKSFQRYTGELMRHNIDSANLLAKAIIIDMSYFESRANVEKTARLECAKSLQRFQDVRDEINEQIDKIKAAVYQPVDDLIAFLDAENLGGLIIGREFETIEETTKKIHAAIDNVEKYYALDKQQAVINNNTLEIKHAMENLTLHHIYFAYFIIMNSTAGKEYANMNYDELIDYTRPKLELFTNNPILLFPETYQFLKIGNLLQKLLETLVAFTHKFTEFLPIISRSRQNIQSVLDNYRRIQTILYSQGVDIKGGAESSVAKSKDVDIKGGTELSVTENKDIFHNNIFQDVVTQKVKSLMSNLPKLSGQDLEVYSAESECSVKFIDDFNNYQPEDMIGGDDKSDLKNYIRNAITKLETWLKDGTEPDMTQLKKDTIPSYPTLIDPNQTEKIMKKTLYEFVAEPNTKAALPTLKLDTLKRELVGQLNDFMHSAYLLYIHDLKQVYNLACNYLLTNTMTKSVHVNNLEADMVEITKLSDKVETLNFTNQTFLIASLIDPNIFNDSVAGSYAEEITKKRINLQTPDEYQAFYKKHRHAETVYNKISDIMEPMIIKLSSMINTGQVFTTATEIKLKAIDVMDDSSSYQMPFDYDTIDQGNVYTNKMVISCKLGTTFQQDVFIMKAALGDDLFTDQASASGCASLGGRTNKFYYDFDLEKFVTTGPQPFPTPYAISFVPERTPFLVLEDVMSKRVKNLAGSPIKLELCQELLKLNLTVKLAFQAVSHILENLDDFRGGYRIENPVTWASDVLLTSASYQERVIKLKSLRKMIGNLDKIETKILLYQGQHYGADVPFNYEKYGEFFNSDDKIYRNQVRLALNMVNGLDPLNAQFNKIADSLWFWTRKTACLAFAYYVRCLENIDINKAFEFMMIVLNETPFVKEGIAVNYLQYPLVELNNYRDKFINNYQPVVQDVISRSSDEFYRKKLKYPIFISQKQLDQEADFKAYVTTNTIPEADYKKFFIEQPIYRLYIYPFGADLNIAIFTTLNLDDECNNLRIGINLCRKFQSVSRKLNCNSVNDFYRKIDQLPGGIRLALSDNTFQANKVQLIVTNITNYFTNFITSMNFKRIDDDWIMLLTTDLTKGRYMQLFHRKSQEVIDHILRNVDSVIQGFRNNTSKFEHAPPIVSPALQSVWNIECNVEIANTVSDIFISLLQNRYGSSGYARSGSDPEKFSKVLISIFIRFLQNVVRAYHYYAMQSLCLHMVTIRCRDFNGKLWTYLKSYLAAIPPAFDYNVSYPNFDIEGIKLEAVDLDNKNFPWVANWPDNDADKIAGFIVKNNTPKPYRIIYSKLKNLLKLMSHFSDDVEDRYIPFFETETQNYRTSLNLQNTVNDRMQESHFRLSKNVVKYTEFVDVIKAVMFGENFLRFALIDKKVLASCMENLIDNTNYIGKLLSNSLENTINLGNINTLQATQINNFQALQTIMGHTIRGKPVARKFYARISFGIVDYYQEVMKSLLDVIEKKDIINLNEVEIYIYRYHYISIKRCYKLFRWLRFEFLKTKQNEDIDKLRADPNHEIILKYKIMINKTKNNVLPCFTEFNTIRRVLDEYASVALKKVQLHLRINDFVSKDNNPRVEKKYRVSTRPELDFLLDYDPKSEAFRQRWQSGDLIFTNDEKNYLSVNFNVLKDLYRHLRPAEANKPFDIYYKSIWEKMKNNTKGEPKGVHFDRIYNTINYPDSEVIASYMSIATNIMNSQGTVIMTYGYSGVGKSVSLFGKNDPPTLGILQAAMEQFNDVDIYLRVFEIYGLGCQYNYYWNPTDPANLQECFPEFYQNIIHHTLETSGDVLKIDKSKTLIFTNRHDVMSYVLDMRDPENGTKFFVVDPLHRGLKPVAGIPNPVFEKTTATSVPSERSATNITSEYFYKKSTYAKIDPKHYRTFADFTDYLDNEIRRKGFAMSDLYPGHTNTQVKGTVNNPASSRSILVYDFQVDIKAVGNKIFVPFLIFDLPGKEDLYKSYVNPAVDTNAIIASASTDTSATNINVDLAQRIYRHLYDDSKFAKKSSYVLNPILSSIFDNNTIIIVDVLRNISNLALGPRLTIGFENLIVGEILACNPESFGFRMNANYEWYYNNNNPFRISQFYIPVTRLPNPPSLPMTFSELLDKDNTIFKDSSTLNTYFTTYGAGYPNVNIYFISLGFIDLAFASPTDIFTYFTKYICLITIAYLIKYQLFDVVVQIIYRITGAASQPDLGGWTVDKIYAFMEGFYINENVMGLLQYLINKILKVTDSGIQSQDDVSDINATISKNFRTAVRYNDLYSISKSSPTIPFDFQFQVSQDVLQDHGDPLRKMDIDKFTAETGIDPKVRTFGKKDSKPADAIAVLDSVVTFENKGTYNNNKIFRKGNDSTNTRYNACQTTNKTATSTLNPEHTVNTTAPPEIVESNRPLLQDILEPYTQKIAFYYLFYVLSNAQVEIKAEEQVQLLNNSMPFIDNLEKVSKLI